MAIPRETFARLTPGPYLHAHLKQSSPTRPNGRRPQEFRPSTINVDSLTHSHGSAVVRSGDTAIVCGVRAEILRVSDMPRAPRDQDSSRYEGGEGDGEGDGDEDEDDDGEDSIARLGLLVPNFELSTGCSPAHLPGNPPGTLAQSLTHRLSSLLETSRMIPLGALRIRYLQPGDEESDTESRWVTKGYWTLYIDVLCIALDGNAFDVAWTAVMSALKTVRLPKAWWDPDQELIVCSPLMSDARGLSLRHIPMATTFAMFTTESPLKDKSHAESWALADPDGLEESVCRERLTVVMTTDEPCQILKLEKNGGDNFSARVIEQCVALAQGRRKEWRAMLGA